MSMYLTFTLVPVAGTPMKSPLWVPSKYPRVQTVSPSQNPLFYNLLKEFEALSGVPVIINTSFNIKGEPIVCTPEDAIKCFLGTDIDYLAIGNYLVEKTF